MKLLRPLIAIAAALALVAGPLVATADAAGTSMCKSYSACTAAGMTNHGYSSANSTEYWRMVSGHNCTNYAAYMLMKAGMSSSRPWSGNGNASAWGIANKDITNATPAIGAIAWWNANDHGAGSAGHVAYVESVSANSIVVSEDNYGGDFYWRVIYKTDTSWPSGFVHFKDLKTSASFPAWRARSVSQSTYTDSTDTQAARISTLTPGQTISVIMRFQNTGDQPWTGLSLQSSSATSVLNGGWVAPNIPAVQNEPSVITGATASFSFPVSIPAGVPDGTAFAETFTLLDATGKPIPLSATPMVFTADTRASYFLEPALGITGTLKQEQVLTAVSGVWDPVQPTLSYQWFRDGKPIVGAIYPAHKLNSKDVGTVTSLSVVTSAPGMLPVTQSATMAALVKSKYSSTLKAKASLSKTGQLVSSNGVYQLVHGKKGDLKIVNRFTGKRIWSSKKYTSSAHSKLRKDGVLVTYSKSGKIVWTSKTQGKKVVKAVLTSKGKLQLYTKKGKVVWKS